MFLYVLLCLHSNTNYTNQIKQLKFLYFSEKKVASKNIAKFDNAKYFCTLFFVYSTFYILIFYLRNIVTYLQLCVHEYCKVAEIFQEHTNFRYKKDPSMIINPSFN